jgi:hypothetical protein
MNKTGFNINEEMFESVSFFNCYWRIQVKEKKKKME